MPMGPLRLIDEVGVDVSDHVATELAHYFGERMKVADVLVKMNEAGLKGRKGGAGFYVYEGKKERVNPDLGKYLPGGASRSLPKQAITDRLLGVMIEEAKLCLKEGVVRSADEVDLGMIMGTGFPPFRGGLMRYAQSIGKA
jgi:3-hydroxyacyl-CoA dehydrogenase/enoyl-CoA hydratase/3-hydroxybutyryl-CoA epimerase